MNIKIKREDFSTLEMFLFGIIYPCHFEMKISFIDSEEIYYYKTIEFNNFIYLTTSDGSLV